MELCEKCGTALSRERNPLFRCAACGFENDFSRYVFACAEEVQPVCADCDERMCRFHGQVLFSG